MKKSVCLNLRFAFIVFAILCTTTAAHAFYATVDGIKYLIYTTGSGASIVATYAEVYFYDDGFSGHANIRSSVSVEYEYYSSGSHTKTLTAPVTSIGIYAFSHCTGLTSVTIPNSVTSIGYRAFDGCTGLTSVTIPNSVTSIGNYAFRDCTGLTSVTIPNSVTSIGDCTFRDCSSLTSVTIPNSVTSIGYRAFYGCTGLTSVTIPNSVTSIGDWAFYNCTGLTSVTIPSSVTSIGNLAFRDCSSLTSMKVASGNHVYDSRNNCNAIIETTSNTLIAGCMNTVIPNSVTSIGDYAFDDCSGLTSVTIPNSVTSIGDGALLGCTGLRDLYSEILDPTKVTLGTIVFYKIPKDSCLLHVPPGTEELYRNADQWKDFMIAGTMATAFHQGFKDSFGDKAPIGVTADGASRMYIYFDRDIDEITSSTVKMTIDGEEITDKRITGDLGDIKRLPNGRYGFDYCAPDVFSSKYSDKNSFDVTIEAEAQVKGGTAITGTATVTVMRPGVLLLHGLFSSDDCFKELTNYLLTTGGYLSCQVLNGSYKGSNAESFFNNTYVRQVVKGKMEQLFRQLADQGIISSKYDLVGHSMGGILSRKYAQEVNPDAVNRIITLDTPHSGSQLALARGPVLDWLKNAAIAASVVLNPKLSKALFRAYDQLSGEDYAALEDLSPSSQAVARLNSPNQLAHAKGIPVHAIASYMYQGTHIDQNSCVAMPASSFGTMSFYYLQCAEVQDNDFGYRVEYRLYNGQNDGIVSLVSQAGGLNYPYKTLESDTYRGIGGRNSNAHHCKTNHWDVSIRNISELLHLPKNSSKFSTDGFKPANLASSGKMKKAPAKAPKPAPATSQMRLSLSRDDATRTLTVKVNPTSDIAHYIVYAFPDDENILVNNDMPESQFIIPDTYDGMLTVYAVGRTTNDELVADMDSTAYESATSLRSLQYEDEQAVTMSVGQTLSFNVIANWDNGQQQYVRPTFTTTNTSILSITDELVKAKSVGQCVLIATYKGKSCRKEITVIPSDMMDGDVNGDKEVNIGDINALLDYIFAGSDGIIPEAADVNGDGEVSIADINAIIDIILGGETTPSPRLPGDVNGDGTVNISDVTALINYIQGAAVSPFNAVNADVNGDGSINITDVLLLIEMVTKINNVSMIINDLNGDGQIDLTEITAFLQSEYGICP